MYVRSGNAGGGALSEVSLWTNGSQTSTFASQDVSLSDNINNYKYIKVKFRVSTSVSTSASVIVSVTDLLTMTNSANTVKFGISALISSATHSRSGYYVSDTKINIGNCYKYNSTTMVNTACIPIEVIGMK